MVSDPSRNQMFDLHKGCDNRLLGEDAYKLKEFANVAKASCPPLLTPAFPYFKGKDVSVETVLQTRNEPITRCVKPEMIPLKDAEGSC